MFKKYGLLYVLEGCLPMWAIRLIPNWVFDLADRFSDVG